MKRIISLLIVVTMVLALVPMTASALSQVNPMASFEGAQADSPKETTFRIEGYDTEFVLLKTTKNNDSRYFVLLKEDVGEHQFDPDGTQKFDPTDENNIAYWLNNTYLEEGWEGQKLPQEVIDHINFQHQWDTEPGNPSNNCPTAYSVKCGLAVMSMTEIIECAENFGLRDNQDIGYTVSMTRTPYMYGWRNDLFIVPAINLEPVTGRTYEYTPESVMPVRAAFWLDGDFFKNVKVQVPSCGRAVKKAIINSVTQGELVEAGYTEEELDMLRDLTLEASESITAEIANAELIGGLVDPEKAALRVNLLVAGSTERTYSVYFNSDDLGVKKTVGKVTVTPGKQVTKDFKLGDILNGEGTLNVTVKEGDRICLEQTLDLKVMPAYKDQFMDEYAERSMGTHYLHPGQNNSNDTYLLNRAGVKRIRNGFGWGNYEESKGSWSYERTDSVMNELSNMDNINIVEGGNNGYFSGNPTGSDKIDMFVENYLSRHFTHYGKFNYMEIWNEPNLGGWNRDATNYMKIVKVSSMEMKKYYDDTNILGGSINSTDSTFLNDMYADRAFAYCDYISYHPYITPTRVDDGYRKSLGKFNTIFLNNGGWVEGYVTEVGWPTHENSQGNSPDKQGMELVKQYIVADSMETRGNAFYDFKDYGTNTREVEQNFGLITQRIQPKVGYYYLTQVNVALGGGVYMGEINLEGGINAHVYMKDHEPVIVLWTVEENATANFDFGEEVTVDDYIGNPVAPVSGNTYEIENHMYYVTGAGKQWFNMAAGSRALTKLAEINERFDGKLPANVAASIADLEGYFNTLVSAPELYDDASLANKVVEIYGIGDAMIEALKNGSTSMEEVEVSTFLYLLQLTAECVANLDMAAAKSNPALTSPARVNTIYDDMYFIGAEVYDGDQLYSNKIFRYARRFSTKASEINALTETNPSKGGVIKGYDLMANELLDWVVAWSAFEDVTSTAFNVEICEDDVTVYEGVEKNIPIGIRSWSTIDAIGTFSLYDPDGNLVISKDNIEVLANSVGRTSVDVTVDYEFNGEKKKFYYEFVSDDGVVLDYGYINFQSEEKIGVSLKPQATTLSGVKELVFTVTNLFTEDIGGKVVFEPCEGWTLGSTEESYNVAAGESTEIKVKVSGTAKRAFNYYTVKATFYDDRGRKVLTQELPIDFLVIVKNSAEINVEDTFNEPASQASTEKITWTGDISNWADAYPVFVHPPRDASSLDEWKKEDIGGMAWLKWDEKYFYLLVNVYDNRYVQLKTGYDIWSQDNIQFALDPKNDKSVGGYSSDDYELGMGFTPSGREFFSWTAAVGGPATGSWDKGLTNMVRDEEKYCTRYIVKLPVEQAFPLELKQGNIIGFNLALNDCDVNDRKSFPQLTLGIADQKNPSLWHSFTMVGEEKANALTDIEKYNLPIELELDYPNSFMYYSDQQRATDEGMKTVFSEEDEDITTSVTPVVKKDRFSDIAGHWAKDDIENMASRGIVDGVGDGKFEPDRQITRAEFIALLAKAGIEATEYEGGLSDVSADDWFAGYIQTGISSGVIPAEMIEGGMYKPEQPITREEMAAMVVKMYEYKSGTTLEDGESVFADEASFTPWALAYANKAYKAGIVNGVDDVVNYDPAASATRAESVVIVKRLLAKL